MILFIVGDKMTRKIFSGIIVIALNGLEQVQPRLYNEEDLFDRFDKAIAAYDAIVEAYSDNVPTEGPVPADGK